jgi:hypothetical protein
MEPSKTLKVIVFIFHWRRDDHAVRSNGCVAPFGPAPRIDLKLEEKNDLVTGPTLLAEPWRLATPMAANFNLVPAAVLEKQDEYGPIKAQVPTAGLVLLVNVGVMYAVAF